MFEYFIIDISFVIMSLVRILRPALFLASEEVEVNKWLHYILFSIIAFVFFPLIAIAVILKPDKFILGYAEAIVND